MEFFKVWIMPPLVGAIIGYFTNWLAIKMLFRPLKPIYIGKLKLPFTPGILPRERLRLTDSVGETVSRELLTPEVFRTRLVEPALKTKIEQSVYVIIDDALNHDASALLKSLAGEREGSKAPEVPEVPGIPELKNFGSSEAGSLVASSFNSIVGSVEFRTALSYAAGRTITEAGKIPLGSILPGDRVRALAERFAGEWGERDKKKMIEAFVDRLLESSPSSGPLVSPRTLSPLAEAATRSLYASLLPIVEKILDSEAVKADLKNVGVDMIRRVIGRLGPIQRLIVTAANYEKTLADTMPETIRDVSGSIIGLLRGPDMENKVVESVLAYIGTPRLSHSSAPLAGIFPISELKRALELFFQGLELEKASFAENVERRYASIAEKSLSELLPGLSEALVGSVEKGLTSTRPADGTRSRIGSDLLSRSLSDFLLSYAEKIEGKTLGAVLSLGEAERRRIARVVSDAVTQALASQSERLVEALDIQTMVVDKLNDLDMSDIERIILKVVNDELTWITVLGGILGAFIGVIQSLLTLL